MYWEHTKGQVEVTLGHWAWPCSQHGGQFHKTSRFHLELCTPTLTKAQPCVPIYMLWMAWHVHHPVTTLSCILHHIRIERTGQILGQLSGPKLNCRSVCLCENPTRELRLRSKWHLHKDIISIRQVKGKKVLIHWLGRNYTCVKVHISLGDLLPKSVNNLWFL